MQKLNTEGVRHIVNHMVGPTRNILLGAGLCYAVKQEYYSHIPLIAIFPSVYAGYHMYENKEQLIKIVKDIIKPQ
jgi:hypothetical protein